MSSLTERLRELDKRGYRPLTGPIGNEAADELDKLRAENESLRNDAAQLPPLTDAMYHAVRGYEYHFTSGGEHCVMGYVDDDMLDELWDAINTALKAQANAAMKGDSA